MTLEKAKEILIKLSETMNYNDRKNQEYSAGLCKSYMRAYRLLLSSPFDDDKRPITYEEIDQIIFILRSKCNITHEWISLYLKQVLLTEKDNLDSSDNQQLLYYLGCVIGLKASISIIEQIEV